MFDSAIGIPGPLIVEHDKNMFFENCIVITEKHINNMIEKIKDIKYYRIEQTTERSFVIIS